MKIKDDSEAMNHANDSRYCLAASIRTRKTGESYDFANDVEAKTVFSNRQDNPASNLVSVDQENLFAKLQFSCVL
jgi:acyl-CoA reductase-like NAD-dependent aldehyde dehydrogenase